MTAVDDAPSRLDRPTSRPILVVCGVAGSGKTTVGRIAADRLGVPFFDADDAHSDAARKAMRSGRPLTDAERAPWLDRLADAAPGTRFVLLTAPPDVLRERLRSRPGHFFPAALLDSQFATLEDDGALPRLDTHALGPDAAADAVVFLVGS